LKKLLRTNNLIIVFFFAAALTTGCGKESPKGDFIARVNKSYFTKENLNSVSNSGKANTLYSSEIIRNWVNRELLFQMAEKEGITKSAEYLRLLEDSKKELAASLMIRKFYEDKTPEVDDDSLESYFASYSDLFRLNNEGYLINRINFRNEDKGILFRTTVIESDWNKATNVFKRDASLIVNHSLLDEPEIHPAGLLRIVRELDPKEVSIVYNTQDNEYTVIQLLEKFPEGSIPPLDVIKDKVSSRYIAEKKEQLFKDYLENLYSHNDIEIKNTGVK
jgi:hypothetical protein